MQSTLLCACSGLLLFVASDAPETETPPAREVQVQAYFADSTMLSFPSHKRANAVVIGNGKTPLGLYVFDPHGNCVAMDDFGNLATKDDLAVEWYVSETGQYGIDIHNFGPALNKAEVAFPE